MESAQPSAEVWREALACFERLLALGPQYRERSSPGWLRHGPICIRTS